MAYITIPQQIIQLQTLLTARVAKDMTGPGIAIPVSAGDKISAEVWARSDGAQPNSNAAAIGGLLGSVANMFGITTGEAPATFNALNDALGVLAGDWGNSSSAVPEAYLNIVFISSDNTFSNVSYQKITASSYGNFEQLNTSYTAPSNGVMYVYVANENSEPGDVWFDDLLIIHEKTTSSLRVAQTNDYYPFGMVMAGTAYNDESRQAQLYKFNGNEVLEGEGIPTTLNLMNFNARLYNPALGVFLAVDPQNQFANPYLAFGNNPVIYVDKDGELAFVPWLVATLVNVGIDALNGNINSWGDFGISLAKGAAFSALGGYNTIAQAIIYPAFAAYAPSYNIPIGDNFSISVSPALFIGNNNLGLGVNVTANAQIGDFSLSGGVGVTGFSKFGATGGNKMGEFRGSYGAGFDDGTFGVGLSSTSFKGGGIPQKIATASVRYKKFAASYTNDWFFSSEEKFNRQILADNGDRWRTGAATVSYGDFSVGVRIFTGDPGYTWEERKESRNYAESSSFFGDYENNADDYRLGIAYVGYKGYRLGTNSQGVANIQNRIHDKKKVSHFRPMIGRASLYYQYVIPNPFTIW